jgi:hypothetical protein
MANGPGRGVPAYLGVAAVTLGLAFAMLFVVHVVFAPPMDYVVRAQFQELPASDDELKGWLLNQPGVYTGFVQREGRTLVLIWGNTRTHFWNPVTPNVRAQFERFGYRGLLHYHEEKSYRDK